MLFAYFCWRLKEWEVAASRHTRRLTGETCLVNALIIVKFSFKFVWYVCQHFVLLKKKMTSVVLQGPVAILNVVPKGILNLQECSHLRRLSVIVTKWRMSLCINPFHAFIFCRTHKKEISTDMHSLYFCNLTLTWQLLKQTTGLCQTFLYLFALVLLWCFGMCLSIISEIILIQRGEFLLPVRLLWYCINSDKEEVQLVQCTEPPYVRTVLSQSEALSHKHLLKIPCMDGFQDGGKVQRKTQTK